LERGSSAIHSALLKYGYSNFKLEILEYCDQELLICREQYYLDLLKPKYNICKTAGSTLGKLHSESTKEKIRKSNSGKNHPQYGKPRSIETKIKISIAHTGVNHHFYGKSLKEETRIKISESLKSKNLKHKIKIFDLSDKMIKEFASVTDAAKEFNVSTRTIGKHLNKNSIYNGFKFKSKAISRIRNIFFE
jgi:group I intron endonuclease